MMKKLTDSDVRTLLRVPGAADHKYTRGVCGIVTGSAEYPGAALLSTRACINTGVGMIRYSATSLVTSMVQMHSPEAVCFSNDVTEQHVQA